MDEYQEMVQAMKDDTICLEIVMEDESRVLFRPAWDAGTGMWYTDWCSVDGVATQGRTLEELAGNVVECVTLLRECADD